MPSKNPIVIQSIATDDDLEAAPIHPDWLLDGAPVTRARRLRLIDDSALSGTIWETTAGRFEWHYGSDELVAILDGEVEVKAAGREMQTLRKGDVVFFPGGQVIHWNVPVYVKKLAINAVRTPLPRRLASRVPFARRVVRRLRVLRGGA